MIRVSRKLCRKCREQWVTTEKAGKKIVPSQYCKECRKDKIYQKAAKKLLTDIYGAPKKKKKKGEE